MDTGRDESAAAPGAHSLLRGQVDEGTNGINALLALSDKVNYD